MAYNLPLILLGTLCTIYVNLVIISTSDIPNFKSLNHDDLNYLELVMSYNGNLTWLIPMGGNFDQCIGMIANEHIRIGINSYEEMKTFKYLGSLVTNQNSIKEENEEKAGNSYYSLQTLLSSRLPSNNLKIKIYKTIILPGKY